MIELVGVPYEEGFNLQPKSRVLADSSEVKIPGSDQRYTLRSENRLLAVGIPGSKDPLVLLPERDSYRLTRMGGYDWWVFNIPNSPSARKRRYIE